MKIPLIYNANPVTGEFIGTSYPDPDPLDGKNWLVPAHAYMDAPPAVSAGEIALRGAAGWFVSVDLRGTVYSTETGQAVEHSEFGALPEGLTILPQPSPAHRWVDGDWVLDAAIVAKLEQERINRDALEYLNQTDWYVIRRQETGEAIPEEVLSNRAAARKVVVR